MKYSGMVTIHKGSSCYKYYLNEATFIHFILVIHHVENSVYMLSFSGCLYLQISL